MQQSLVVVCKKRRTLPVRVRRELLMWVDTHTHTHTHTLILNLSLSLSLSLSPSQICWTHTHNYRYTVNPEYSYALNLHMPVTSDLSYTWISVQPLTFKANEILQNSGTHFIFIRRQLRTKYMKIKSIRNVLGSQSRYHWSFKAGPPWFEILVIFDFFAPWYRKSREASSVKIS